MNRLIPAIIIATALTLAGCSTDGRSDATLGDNDTSYVDDAPRSDRDRVLDAVADANYQGQYLVDEDPDLVWDVVNDACDAGIYETAVNIADVAETDSEVEDMATLIGAGMNALCPGELDTEF